jgi:hypothetical protein
MAGEAHKATADRMITDARLDEIAGEVALLKDDDGYAPTDDLYTTTVDIYRAAAECWREKAGMVADGYDFKAEGASFTRSQMFQHYLEQASRYAAMAGSLTMSVGRPVDPGDETSNAWEDYIELGGGLP